MDKIQLLKMLLEACGNAGEEAAKLAILYFSMDMAKFTLLLLLWAALAFAAYKFLRHLVDVNSPLGIEQSLFITVRDDIFPEQRGSVVDDYERRRVIAALTEAWNKRPKT